MFQNTKMVSVGFKTDSDKEDVKNAAKKALRSLGGSIRETRQGLEIDGGCQGVSFAFAAEFRSIIDIKERSSGNFEIIATINYKPSMITWVCTVIGLFFLWFLWFVPIVYFFIDPTQAYQQALNRIENELED